MTVICRATRNGLSVVVANAAFASPTVPSHSLQRSVCLSLLSLSWS